ncbi:MAG: sulfatase [Kiritimatiellia bacterium]|jgi:arylsulfatase A-like enzyme|nr:sulfatase [Kiritimatiellia bacterium]
MVKTKKQTTILFLAVSLLCVAGKTSEGKDSVRQEGKPNILFIAIDDLNDWTGTLKDNPQARTPHMDKLASKGMVFLNAHCAAPACGPSRSAIMSGIRPSTSGNYINKSSLIHNPILNNSVLLPEFFQQNGYYVCGAGKLFHGYHFNKEVKGRGFDEYYPSKEQDLPPWEFKFSRPLPLSGIKGMGRPNDWGPYHPDITIEDTCDGKTAKWAEEKLLGGELKEPFFLGAGIFEPHLPNYTLQKYFDEFPLDEIKLPEGYRENDLDDVPRAHSKMAHNPWLKKIRGGGQWKHAIQAYLACSAMADDLVGQIVRALEKSKYADNTIIVLWSDHGFQLGEKERWGKYSLWERATRVNMIWVAPGVTQPGATSARPVNLLDIYPTLASLTGCKPPEGQLEGNDLSVLMKDPDAKWDKTTVTTFGYKNYGVRSERYRYIVYADGTEELYDRRKDKWEWHNLADNPEYAHVKERMRKGIPDHHEPSGVTYVPPRRKGKVQ